MHLKTNPVILSHKGQHPSVRRIPRATIVLDSFHSRRRSQTIPFSFINSSKPLAQDWLPVEVFDQGDDQLVFELGRHPSVELVLLAPLQVMYVQTNPVVFRSVGHHLSLGALLLADYGF